MNTNEDLQARLRIIATDYEPGSILRKTIEDVIATLARQEEGREAVYQHEVRAGEWRDIGLDEYQSIGEAYRRILYTHPAPPIAALAPHNDGEVPRYRVALERDGRAFGYYLERDPNGDLCKYAEAKRVLWASALAEVATPTPQAEPAGGGEAMAWQYRWKQEGPCACTYNTFRHPINDMRMDPKSIDWWVYGVKPTTPTPQAAGVSEEMVSAVRFAPTSAYWSGKLVEFFGPAARSGIDALDARIRELAAAGAAPEGWQAKAHELLDRLAKASPPNVLHQQLTILGDMAALLRCMYPQQPGAQHGQEGRDHG